MSTHNNRTKQFHNNRNLEELWCQQLKTTDPNPGWLWSSCSRLWSQPPSVSCRWHPASRCYSLEGLDHRRRCRKTWSWIRIPRPVPQNMKWVNHRFLRRNKRLTFAELCMWDGNLTECNPDMNLMQNDWTVGRSRSLRPSILKSMKF
jgi:hypothetical protein